MPVPQGLLDKITGYEQQGYKPEEIVAGLAESKNFPGIAQKVNGYLQQGYSPFEILDGIKSSPIEQPQPPVTPAEELQGLEGSLSGFFGYGPQNTAIKIPEVPARPVMVDTSLDQDFSGMGYGKTETVNIGGVEIPKDQGVIDRTINALNAGFERIGDTLTDPNKAVAVAANLSAGGVKGITLGTIDPTRGTIGIPFGKNIFQYGRPVGQALQEELGLSPEEANNSYVQAVGDMATIIIPWSATSRLLARGVHWAKALAGTGTIAKIAETSQAARPYLPTTKEVLKAAIERTGIQAASGAIIGGAHPITEGPTTEEERQKIVDDTYKRFKASQFPNVRAEESPDWVVTDQEKQTELYQNINKSIQFGESRLRNILSTAAIGAGLHIIGEAANAFMVLKAVDKYKAFENARDKLGDLFFDTGRFKNKADADKAAESVLVDTFEAGGGFEKVKTKNLKKTAKELEVERQARQEAKRTRQPEEATDVEEASEIMAEGEKAKADYQARAQAATAESPIVDTLKTTKEYQTGEQLYRGWFDAVERGEPGDVQKSALNKFLNGLSDNVHAAIINEAVKTVGSPKIPEIVQEPKGGINDRQNTEGVSSQVGIRQEPVETKPVETAGGKEAEGSGILQTSEEGIKAGPAEARTVKRMSVAQIRKRIMRGITNKDKTWITGDLKGEPIYSNGHIALLGTPPVYPNDIDPNKPDFNTLMSDDQIKKAVEVVPVAYQIGKFSYRDEPVEQIVFSDGKNVLNADYYDFIKQQYPDATFKDAYPGEKKLRRTPKPLLIYSKGKHVGFVSPVQSDISDEAFRIVEGRGKTTGELEPTSYRLSELLKREGDTLDNKGNIVLSPAHENKIKEAMFYNRKGNKVIPNNDQRNPPGLVLTGGPPGAGKTTSYEISGINKDEYAVADADKVKILAGYEDFAEEAHEASSKINKEVADIAMNNNYPLIYDSLMTNFNQTKRLIEAGIKQGRPVKVVAVDISAETSQVRSLARVLKGESNRLIPPSASAKGYNYAIPNFIELYKLYKDNPNIDFYLMDNDVDGAKAKLIFSKVKGLLTIGDQEQFDKLVNNDYTYKGDRYERPISSRTTAAEIGGRLAEIERRVREIISKSGERRGLRSSGELDRTLKQFRELYRGEGGITHGIQPGRVETNGPTALEGTPAEDVQGTKGRGIPGSGGGKRGGENLQGPGEDREGSPGAGVHEGPGGKDSLGTDEGRIHPVADRRGSAEPGGEPTGEPGSYGSLEHGETAEVDHNYRLTPTDAEQLGAGSFKQKYHNNLEAIKLVKQLQEENRQATPEEQNILAKFVGWGGMPQAFDYYNRQWAAENQQLKDLLTYDEYDAARASTPNAHYTAPEVVRSMWAALEKMGFKGGKVLEPASGAISIFFSLIPDNLLKRIRATGIELDQISGAIAKQLYPRYDMRTIGFEKANLPDNYYDLAISNVPFGNYKLHDPRYNKYNFSIHDYFFAKALDKVRPGGMVAFITTRFTMDAKAGRIRTYLADKADLIAAIRLPNTTFKKIANTEVVTDIIFLRKKTPGAPSEGAPWEKSTPLENGIYVNEYYHQHPEMMLGKMETGKSGLYSDNEATLTPTGNPLEDDLQSAVNTLPENVFRERAAQTRRGPEAIEAPGHVKEGGHVVKDRKVYIKKNGELVEQKTPAIDVKRIEGLIKIRDIRKALIQKQLATQDDEAIKGEMKELNRVYDDFVKKYGYITARANRNVFKNDPDYPLLAALENRPKVENGAPTKADIFTKRVLYPKRKMENIGSSKEALLASLNEYNRVDINHMMKLTGKSQKDLIAELEGLIYHDPVNGEWFPEDEYLSGNVRKKLEEALAAAEHDDKYQVNVSALKKVQPEDIPAEQIDSRLGASWIPPQHIESFMKDVLNVRATVRYAPAIGTWTIAIGSRGSRYYGFDTIENTTTYGTDRIYGHELVLQALNQKIPTIRDRTPDDKYTVNVPATEAAREKQTHLKARFKEWIWEDPGRMEELHRKYNDEMNNIRDWKPNGQHLELHGSSPSITLHPHQKDAAWRIIRSGNTLLAHAVGAGKTFSMIAASMEMKRVGLVSKPMFVVPNHLLEQWGIEFARLYPNAKILLARKEDLSPENRKMLVSRVANNDWDAVIITHSSFTKIPMSDKVIDDFYKEQIEELEDYILESRHEEGRNSRIVKELEKAKFRLMAKMQARYKNEIKDITVEFEELGVDALFVDEAHAYKNLFFPTKMTRVAGLSNTDSQRAFDMFLKTRYLNKKTGNRSVVFATGTPISNSIAEMFTMQRYLQYEILKERGAGHFDSWAADFGEVVSSMEIAPEGKGYRVKMRFARFSNIPELMQMYRLVADLQTREMLNLPIPTIKSGKAVVRAAKSTDWLREYIGTLVNRAERIRKGVVHPHQDNMLKVTNDGRKAALDPRLVDLNAPVSKESKTTLAAEEIYRIWKETKKDKGTQLVFINLGTPKDKGKKKGPVDIEEDTGFNVYEDLKGKLIKLGIPKDDIAFIHDAKTDRKKQDLFDKVNSGKVRILFGSNEKMGEGMNVQERLYALHHVDAPWRPSDIEQREGRILRQGNTYKEVEIYRYVTEESFDAYMWQILENKARFIAQVSSPEISTRSAEDIEGEALTFAEVKAIASGNPIVLEKVKTDTEIRRLDILRAHWKIQQEKVKGVLARGKEGSGFINTLRNAIENTEADIKALKRPEEFEIEIEKKKYTDRKEATAKIQMIAAKHMAAGKVGTFPVGEYGNLPILLRAEENMQPYLLIGKAESFVSITATETGTIQSLEHTIKELPRYLQERKDTLERNIGEIKKAEAEVGKPFKDEAKYQELIKKQKELNSKLDLDKNEITEALEEEVKEEPEKPILDPEDEGEIMDFMGMQHMYRAIKKLLYHINPGAYSNVSRRIPGKELGIIKSLLASPESIPGKARYYVVHAKNAILKQDRLRSIAEDRMKKIFDPLNKQELTEFTTIQWLGDMQVHEFTRPELAQMGISEKAINAYLEQRHFHKQVWRLLAAHRKSYGGDTGYVEGHVPHLFENWNVYEMQEVEVDGEMVIQPTGILGTFRSLREATIFANSLDPNQQYVIKPKTVRLPDELLLKTVMKTGSYIKLIEKIENAMSLSSTDAAEIARSIARMTNKRRFFGNVMHRTGQTGYKRGDIAEILKQYYYSTARYIALDDFKSRVVRKFERDFGVELGRASSATHNRTTAQYIEQYINDVNGVPGRLEELLDASLRGVPIVGQALRSQRPTIWAVNKALHAISVLKLGVFNLSAGIVNLTQLTNTFAKIPIDHFAYGFAHGIKPLAAERAILRRIGVQYQLGLGDTGGYSKTHRGGKLVSASMFFFRGAEAINRRVTALAAYRYAIKDLGLNEKKARIYAGRMVDVTQFDYSVADTPRIFRNPLGRFLGQFKPYAVKELEFVLGLKGAEKIKFWIPILLIAGLGGIPMAEGMSDVIEWITGTNPIFELKKFLMSWAGSDKKKKAAAEIAMYGIGSQLGIDISRRVGLGDLWPKRASDLLGPTVNTLLNAKKITEMGDKTEFAKNLSPAIGNILTAIETIMNNMEVADPYHRERLKYTATPGQVAAKAVSLRPIKEAELSDLMNIEKYEQNKYSAIQKEYVDKAIRALEEGNADKFVDALVKAAEKGVVISDKNVQDEIIAKALPQEIRTLIKTRTLLKPDYVDMMEFVQ